MRARWMLVLSWAGLVVFAGATGAAMLLYPGGNRFEPGADGHRFFGNFLCDLFSQVSYSGAPNPGRAYALAGVYALALGLLAFWLLNPSPRARSLGAGAMILSLFIPTELHDACILIAAPLGFMAVVASVRFQFRHGRTALAWMGTAAVGVSVANYLLFAFRVLPSVLPGIQKAALLSFLGWVLASLRTAGKAKSQDPCNAP